MDRLKRRADFVAAAKGARVQAAPFLMQVRDRRDRKQSRVGFTVTKQTGKAVERNRIRRRLRAAADAVLPHAGRPGFDYVLVARRPALTVPFDRLLADLEHAVSRAHAPAKTGQRPARPVKPSDGEADD